MDDTCAIRKDDLSQWLDKLTTAYKRVQDDGRDETRQVRVALEDVVTALADVLGVPQELTTCRPTAKMRAVTNF